LRVSSATGPRGTLKIAAFLPFFLPAFHGRKVVRTTEGIDVKSAGTRGFTVVTIVVLVFAPVLKQHGWAYKLVSRHETTTTVACAAADPCPATRTETQKQYLSDPVTTASAAKPKAAKSAAAAAPKKTARPASKATKATKAARAKQAAAAHKDARSKTRAKSAAHARPTKKHAAKHRRG
jgi:hypothetical protein